jgi:type I phosphodiesterase/nucleotide pyrophosphatase
LRPDYMQSVIAAGNAPNFKRFQDEGAWTNNARTDYTHTITLPNHTSMITGRPVSQPAGLPAQTQHGYTDNSDPAPTTTLHNFTTPDWYKASTFDVVHDAGFTTAMYASKNKFILYDQSYNAANGAPNANGSDKITTYYGPESTAAMQSQVLSGLAANHFKYTFVHYADTDDAGHGSGWGSAAYNAAVTTIDGYLGQLFNLVQNDATLVGKTAIILSADHGGSGTGHSDATLAVDYTIPFFAWGAGVAHGDIYSFNLDTRTNPGTSRPTYTAPGQPIRNGDGGNLALSLLGLGPIPGSLINAAQNLRVAPVPESATAILLLIAAASTLMTARVRRTTAAR